MAVYQSGNGAPPALLLRFRSAVGDVGLIHGPARGYLYQWHSKRNVVVDVVSELLWPWLSDAKRTQLRRAASEVSRPAPTVADAPWTRDELLAWAAGFFDGEGSIGVYGMRRAPSMYLPQSSTDGIPNTLGRFRAAIGAGNITGPRTLRSRWTKLPQYSWRTQRFAAIEEVVRLLRPYSDVVKLGEMDACLQLVRERRAGRTG